VFKEITLVGLNQGNYFENATACSKRTLKTTVTTQLHLQSFFNSSVFQPFEAHGTLQNLKKFGGTLTCQK